jgi:hypothetical protein
MKGTLSLYSSVDAQRSVTFYSSLVLKLEALLQMMAFDLLFLALIN